MIIFWIVLSAPKPSRSIVTLVFHYSLGLGEFDRAKRRHVSGNADKGKRGNKFPQWETKLALFTDWMYLNYSPCMEMQLGYISPWASISSMLLQRKLGRV